MRITVWSLLPNGSSNSRLSILFGVLVGNKSNGEDACPNLRLVAWVAY